MRRKACVLAIALVVALCLPPGVAGAQTEYGAISGWVVTAAGGPIGGVTLVAYGSTGFPGRATAGPDGWFEIQGLPYDTYAVFCPAQDCYSPPEDYLWARQRIFGVVVDETNPSAGLVFQLQPAGIVSGTVTGPDGQPLGGMYLEAQNEGGTIEGYACGWTEADGGFRLAGLPTGNYRVGAIYNPGYANQYYLGSRDWDGATLVAVAAGQETTGIDFALEPGGSISGQVMDPDGNPISGVSLLLESPGIQSSAWQVNEFYRIDGLPYGDYTLTCPAGLWGPADEDWESQVITVTIGQDWPEVTCDFILNPAPVVVTGTVKFTPTVWNLSSSADLCARVELEPGYDPGQVDLTSLALESDLGGAGAERAEVREGLLWVWFDHEAVASILTVGDDLTLTIRGTIGTVELAAVGHLRVVAPRRAK